MKVTSKFTLVCSILILGIFLCQYWVVENLSDQKLHHNDRKRANFGNTKIFRKTLNMVAVIPVSTRVEILKLTIQGMTSQVVRPDVLVIYIDYDASASTTYLENSVWQGA